MLVNEQLYTVYLDVAGDRTLSHRATAWEATYAYIYIYTQTCAHDLLTWNTHTHTNQAATCEILTVPHLTVLERDKLDAQNIAAQYLRTSFPHRVS